MADLAFAPEKDITPHHHPRHVEQTSVDNNMEIFDVAVQRRHDMGEGGNCICPRCDEKTPHRSGIPCQEERCPACGAKMLREGSEHHRLLLEKRAKQQQKSEAPPE